MTNSSSIWLRWVAAVLLFAVALMTSSCGRRDFAEVSGTVTVDGKPVTAGTVYFVAVDNPNLSGGGSLGPDGSFKVSAPIGKVKMAVQTGAFKPRTKGAGGGGAPSSKGGSGGGMPGYSKGGKSGQQGKPDNSSMPDSSILSKTGSGAPGGAQVGTVYVPIPERYESADSSGLEFEIKSGSNDLGEIKLTGK